MREETPLWVRRGLVRGGNPFVAAGRAVREETPAVEMRASVRGVPLGELGGEAQCQFGSGGCWCA